eukprot:sb/3478633/
MDPRFAVLENPCSCVGVPVNRGPTVQHRADSTKNCWKNPCHATQSVSSALSAYARPSGSRKLTPGLRPGVRADRQGTCQQNPKLRMLSQTHNLTPRVMS